MKSRRPLGILLVGLLLIFGLVGHACADEASPLGGGCTAFCLTNGNGHPVVGSNVDFGWEEGLVFVNKRNVAKIALDLIDDPEQEPARWVSRYGSVTFSHLGREMPTTGGMNEVGLTVVPLLVGTYTIPPDSRPYVYLDAQWIQYQLDNCVTIEDVIASDSQVRPAGKGDGFSECQWHFLTCDSSGDCAIVEFINGQMVYYTGVDLPHRAVANNPYAQSLSYLSNFVGFGGTTPIPGPSPLSLSRFVRAAYRLQTYDGSDGIGYAFDTLDYVKSGTKWSIVYEVQNLRIHFRTLSNPQIRQIDLSFFDFSCDTPVKMLDIESNLSGDVSSEFIDYSDQTNCDLVTLMSTRWAQMYHREPDMEQIDAMCQYPEESTLCLGATTGPVPESAVFALLGVGVMGVGGFLLFRQRRQLKRLNS